MRTSRLARLLLLGLATVATLEVSLRVAATGSSPFASALRQWDPDAKTLELLGDSCFRAGPLERIRFPNGKTTQVNGMGFRGPEVAVPKPPGTYRVVLLGGSTSHGFLVGDDETIDAHLRRALDVPGAARVEVVNLGLETLDALCDRERLAAEGLALGPDAVIVHTGINDVAALRFAHLEPNAHARGMRAVIRTGEETRQRARGAWRTIKHLFLVARLPGVLRHLLGAPQGPLGGPPHPEPAALDAFERTIHDIVDLVPPGVVVLLSSPPSGLDTPVAGAPTAKPFVVDAATTQRYRDRLDERLRRVAEDAAARGRRVRYVPHRVPDEVFIDDCHVTSEGNRLLADDFARALRAEGLSLESAR